MQQDFQHAEIREAEPGRRPARAARGKDLIVKAFRKHAEQMKRVLSEWCSEELHALEVALKKVGKRADALMEQS